MLTVAMVVAAVYGVLQLAVLGWPARTVGVGVLLLAVGVGVYGAGVIAVLLQIAYTRGVAALTGDPMSQVVSTAGYTVDPFIEEVIKIVPLLLIGLYARSRTQWGVTDYLLAGAGIGAGFGLLEAVLRFSHRVENAIGASDGWVLPTGFATTYIPGPGATLTSWLPAPATSELLSFDPGTGTFLHLAWSAVAGVGIGVLFRVRGPLRLLGLLPLPLVGADHAAYNFDLNLTTQSRLGDLVSAPFVVAQPLLWLWPLLALGLALWLDLRTLRGGLTRLPQLRLAREPDADLPARLLALPRYALHRPPWTALLVLRFVRMRRAALYGAAAAGPDQPIVDRVGEIRAQLDATDSGAAWQGRGLSDLFPRPAGGARWWRRYWPLLVWAALLLPPLLYFGLGSTPGATWVQDLLGSNVVFPVLGGLMVIGVLWIGWGLVATVRGLPAAVRSPEGVVLVRLQLRALTAAGAMILGGLAVVAWWRGGGDGARLISNVHVLDALSDALLVLGIGLLLAAFVFFPPAGLAAVAGGGAVLVPTITTGFLTLGTLGLTSIMLSQAASSVPPSSGGRAGGGGQGGQGGQGLPQQPPRPRPPVRHWRLRRIVDDLWKGTSNPNRVGDGTTMDAVRNELLTGRPSGGTFHSQKAREAINALDNWLGRYGSQASRADREWAWRLRSELLEALGGP